MKTSSPLVPLDRITSQKRDFPEMAPDRPRAEIDTREADGVSL